MWFSDYIGWYYICWCVVSCGLFRMYVKLFFTLMIERENLIVMRISSGVTCKQPISAQSKISLVDGQPCCVNCYEDKHAKRCSRCQKAILADVEYLEFEDKYWHKECFTCSKCQVRRMIFCRKKHRFACFI